VVPEFGAALGDGTEKTAEVLVEIGSGSHKYGLID